MADDDTQRQLWRLSGIGFTLASEIAAGALLGWLVDHWFNTAPWGIFFGCTAGVLVGLAGFLRSAMKANREALEKRARAGPLPPPQVEHSEPGAPGTPGEADEQP